ncbi:MAG: 16S rRNA (uracil(1498)-N(3))-methyltransferase [Pseudomonadota bacterium]
MTAKVRLFVDHPLGEGQQVALSREQAHYLFGVMRLGPGAAVALFNGRDGEWQAEVAEAGKRGGTLVARAQSKPLMMPPDLWLLFAPIKKARTDFIVEKAAEMGARRIVPVITEYTQSARVAQDRLQAHAVEAAEQCGGTFVPEVAEAVRLDRLMAGWDAGRMIMFCDETCAGTDGPPLLMQFQNKPLGPWAILIGPEGGFSDRDRRCVNQNEGQVLTVPLGPRILRADTAAVAAMTMWQSVLGDWA